MRNLFEAAAAQEMKERVARLHPQSERQWGKMTAAQAMAHCATALEFATGDKTAPRMFLGRLIGGMVKSRVLGDIAPLQRNTPTAPSLVIRDERNLNAEQQRLVGLIDRFASGGPAACTIQPHAFFGPMTPGEWALLMYKHLDHHLRQFGA